MKLRDAALLFVLAAIWGAAFLFVRVAVPVLGPFPLVASRLLLGGVLLFVYASAIKQTPNWRAHWRRYVMIGIFNNAIPYVLISTAQLHLTASFASLLNATTPLFSAVIAALWIQDRLTVPKLIGLGLGIVGVGVIVGWQQQQVDAVWIVSVLLMFVSACSYGIAAVYSKIAFKGISPVSTATGQLLVAGGVVLPFAVLNPPQMDVQPLTILAVVALATLSTAVAFQIYFHLIASAGPTSAASVTLLVPFFSSLWAAIFLGEQLHANEIVGFFIILVGLLLVTGLWRYVVILYRRTAPQP
ncbi:MAG: DMT family transporter [Chloroflexi bacterium]|nr:DMT family transporter [Chloroflexota bacterium]